MKNIAALQPKMNELKERYPGLQTAAECSWTGEQLDILASLIEQHVPVDELLRHCLIPQPSYQGAVPAPLLDRAAWATAAGTGQIRFRVAERRSWQLH